MTPHTMQELELLILVGIPASGKTTFYRRRLAGEYAHISLDNWRGKSNVRAKEREAILSALAAAASDASMRGVAVDNTNTTPRTRQRYFETARQFADSTGRAVALTAYFFDADLKGCLARNAHRPKDPPPGEGYFVPPAAIASFHARLERPTHAEGFARIVRVSIAEGGDFEVADVPPPA